MSSSSWVNGSRSAVNSGVVSVVREQSNCSAGPNRHPCVPNVPPVEPAVPSPSELDTGVGRTYGQTVNQLLYVTISPTSNRPARSGRP